MVHDVPRGAHVPSISDVFLEAFVCENEIHDLFGVSIDGIAIDFLGNFYQLSTEKPMTIISPEQLAEREKQRKIAAAKAAKEAEEGRRGRRSPEGHRRGRRRRVRGRSSPPWAPKKAAKVRAAMEAKRAKQAQADGTGE